MALNVFQFLIHEYLNWIIVIGTRVLFIWSEKMSRICNKLYRMNGSSNKIGKILVHSLLRDFSVSFRFTSKQGTIFIYLLMNPIDWTLTMKDPSHVFPCRIWRPRMKVSPIWPMVTLGSLANVSRTWTLRLGLIAVTWQDR
jgi:hypothetical protein